MERRIQLTKHHTAAHIITSVCRKILGLHVWQQGAKKTQIEAHVDISHYQSLTRADELAIETEANKLIHMAIPISTYSLGRTDAEQKHGFRLYQGGAIPGSNLRIVDIKDVDVEACCGTHCKNTSELGIIQIAKSQRIADGIVRITFVAGERAYEEIAKQEKIISDLCELWGIETGMIVRTAERFFKDFKKLSNDNRELEKSLLESQVRCIVNAEGKKGGVVFSQKQEPTVYFSGLGKHAMALKDCKKGIAILGNNFAIGIIGDADALNMEKLAKLFEAGKLKIQNRVASAVIRFISNRKRGSKKKRLMV